MQNSELLELGTDCHVATTFGGQGCVVRYVPGHRWMSAAENKRLDEPSIITQKTFQTNGPFSRMHKVLWSEIVVPGKYVKWIWNALVAGKELKGTKVELCPAKNGRKLRVITARTYLHKSVSKLI